MKNRAMKVNEVQEVILNLVLDIATFMSQNNRPVFLLGGSLLGYERHGGFIPWDDDFDLGMKRDDYEWFLNNYQPIKGVELISEGDKRNFFPYSRVTDIHTRAVSEFYVQNMGIFVDVFPIDTFVNKGFEVRRFLFTHKILNVLRNAARSTGKHAPNAKFTLLKKVLELIIPVRLTNYFARLELKHADTFIKKVNKSEGEQRVSGVMNGMYGRREFFPSEYWDEYTVVDFLGVKVAVINQADSYLTQMFGNWRIPKKQSNQHAKFYKK